VFEEAAMLIELSVVEQRHLAVCEVLATATTITQVPAQYDGFAQVGRQGVKLRDQGEERI
jgi:hypothetical protein